MARLLAGVVALFLLLSGCSSISLGAWDNQREDNCGEEHPNGRWAQELCREGSGVLVWWNWLL